MPASNRAYTTSQLPEKYKQKALGQDVIQYKRHAGSCISFTPQLSI
jgi:hypothetical protein